MPAIKVLANLFASLQNSEMRHKKECIVIPASSLAGEVLTVLQKRRYIGEFELDIAIKFLEAFFAAELRSAGAREPRQQAVSVGVGR